ncbi:MAG: DUF423 domain-containing protein [Rhodomicrobiaceae bacterium]
MAFRIWLFVSGLLALSALMAAAYGAHQLKWYAPGTMKLYETAQLYHMVHAMALFGLAVLFAATDGRRRLWAGLLLNVAALGFVAGIAMFSGGLYYEVFAGVKPQIQIVPMGGLAFMTGWAAVSLATFGFRRQPPSIEPRSEK